MADHDRDGFRDYMLGKPRTTDNDHNGVPPTVPPGWKQMPSGKGVDLAAPSPAFIDFNDIAMSLSLNCRFNGAMRDPSVFYSVAQHCILVSHLIPDEWAAYGLLHDAHEAYFGDLITPFKRLLGAAMPEAVAWYDDIRAQWDKAIWIAAALPPPSPAAQKAIKEADTMALAIERRDLLAPPKDATTVAAWARLPWPSEGVVVGPLAPIDAYNAFLARLAALIWTSPQGGHA